jgi:hypothetical protein
MIIDGRFRFGTKSGLRNYTYIVFQGPTTNVYLDFSGRTGLLDPGTWQAGTQ